MDVFGRIMAGAVTGVGFALGKWAFDTARQTVQHGQMHQLPTVISGLRHSLVPRRAQSAPASSDDTEDKTNKRKTPPPPDDAENKGSSEPPVKRPRMGTESEAGPSGSGSRTEGINAQGTSIAQPHDINNAATLSGNPHSANAGGASADANPSNSSANPVYATAVSSPSQSSSGPAHASPVAPPRHWSPLSVAGTGHMDIDFLMTPSMPQTQGAPLPDAAAAHHTPEVPATVSERLYEDFIHLHDRPAPQTNTPSTRASARYPQVPYVSAHDAYLQSQLAASRRQTSGSPRLRYSRTDKGKGKAFYKSSKLLTHTPTQPEFIQGSSQPRRRTTKPYRLFGDLPPIRTLGLLRALPKSDRKQSSSPQKRFAKLRRPTRSPTPPPRTFNRIFSSSPFCSCEHPVPYMPASPSPAPSSYVPSPTGSDVPLPSGLLFQSPFPQRGSPLPPRTPEAHWRTPQLTMPVLPHPPMPPAPRPAHATLAPPPLQHPVPQTLHSGVPSQLARSADLNAQAMELLSEVEADYNWRRRNGMAEPAAEESDADERGLSASPTPPAGWHPALEQPLSPLNGDAFGRSTYPDYSPGPSRAPLAAPGFGLAQFVAALEPVLPPIASLPTGYAPSRPASASGSDVGSLMYPSSGSARKLSSSGGFEEYESEEEDELAEEEEEL